MTTGVGARGGDRAARRWAGVRARLADDRGNAILEFLFVAVLVMAPLVYVVVLFATIQRDQLAVTTAAREAGRAYATAPTPAAGLARAQVAARLAYQDAGLSGPVRLRWVPAGAGCDAAPITPTQRDGAEFTVCVVDHDELPAVPVYLQGRHGLSSEGRYLVHIDDYR